MLAMFMSTATGVLSITQKAEAANYGISSPRIAADGTVTWDKIQFGRYKQTAKFEKQPIKWRILSISEDGKDAFLLSDKALDCKVFNEIGVEEMDE